MDTKLYSNLKLITSGDVPTTETLDAGELAFGKITATGDHYLYGNVGSQIVEFMDTSVPPFIYYCTGDKDSTAIAKIVNDFFNGGTAMSMKLIISGTMGIDVIDNIVINMDGVNTRGATLYLDFSACSIPKITDNNIVFINSSAINYKLNIYGLNVVLTNCVRAINGVDGSHFDSCTIDCSNVTNSCGLHSVCNCIFTDCTINTRGSSVINATVQGYSNIFTNCTLSSICRSSAYARTIHNETSSIFVDCKITADSTSNQPNYAISQGTNNIFKNCTISGVGTTEYYNTSAVSLSNSSKFIACVMNVTSVYTNIVDSVSDSIFDSCKMSGQGSVRSYAISRGSSNVFTHCEINAVSDTLSYVVENSRDVTFTDCILSSSGTGNHYGIYSNISTISGFIKLEDCILKSSSNYAIYVSGTPSGNSYIYLINCSLMGGHDMYDVYQSTSTTYIWYVSGCKFSKVQTRINGTSQIASTNTITNKVYMPAYANKFGVTVE